MKGGTFRGFIAVVSGLFTRFDLWRKGIKQYDDPHLNDPHHHQRSKASTRINNKGRKRYAYPPCHPGTIAYHDKLVRHFGRREADKIGRAYLAGDVDALPNFGGSK